jgi:hypothetical protein
LANLFDSTNYPGNIPNLIVGDQWAWKREDIVTDYPTADYTLTYSMRLLSSAATEIALDSTYITESATAYTVIVPSAVTVNLTKGDYSYQEYITNGSSQRISINEGFITIEANLDADTSDPRSHARVVLDSLEAMLENRANIDQSSMSIAGRSLSRMTPQEIRDWYEFYRYRVSLEKKKDRISKGEATGQSIKVRF